jgi:serine/threonine-protein kinase
MSEWYRLLNKIGRGAMGVVWRAEDTRTGETVALKLLHSIYAEDAAYRQRFEREAELAGRIDSPYVVKVKGFGVRNGNPYLVLEYVAGPSLREHLAARGPYTWPDARRLMADIAQGLDAAHAAGIVHRDLKPSNVLLAPDGIAKLSDFGIAKALDLTGLTGAGTLVLGTPTYLAPEGPLDERSDLYSLGVIAYELLAGTPPFEASSYQAIMLAHIRTQPDLGRLPPDARPLVGRLLAKDPAKRPARAGAVLANLAAAEAASKAGRFSSRSRMPSAIRRTSRRGFAAGFVGLATIVLIAVATGLFGRAEPPTTAVNDIRDSAAGGKSLAAVSSGSEPSRNPALVPTEVRGSENSTSGQASPTQATPSPGQSGVLQSASPRPSLPPPPPLGSDVVGSPPPRPTATTTPALGSPGQAPAVPASISADPQSETLILISWSPSSGAAGYTLSDNQSFTNVSGSTNSYQWIVTPGTYTCLHVRAFNALGTSGWTDWACSSTPGTWTGPAIPTNVKVRGISSSQISITWVDNATTEAGYRVRRWNGTAFGIIVDGLAVNTTSYVNSGLAPTSSYTYSVCAYNGGGESCSSSVIGSTTP